MPTASDKLAEHYRTLGGLASELIHARAQAIETVGSEQYGTFATRDFVEVQTSTIAAEIADLEYQVLALKVELDGLH